MVTVGRGLPAPAFEFFEGMRSYDPKRAVTVLADDVAFASPWSGPLHGKAAVEAFLKTWLGDAKSRPSLTISDVTPAGALVRFRISVSGRFGKAPEHFWMDVLRVQDKVHQVTISSVKAVAAH